MLFRVIISVFVSTVSLVFFALPAVAQTTVVGSMSSEFTVAHGDVNYSIPLTVAPGRAGMQPKLSIDYSSANNHNGLLGIGWSLQGLSAITRCKATYAHDGFVSGINFDNSDRYCLDGQRLIPIDGENGAAGTEYRTDIDNYAQIISVGGANNDPDYFVVKTKAGHVVTYGGSGNASHRLPQGTINWSIRKMDDTTGRNAIFYNYSFDQNTQYLDSIQYIGGRVDMEYEVRPDSKTSFFAGTKMTVAKRFRSLTTYVSSTKLGQYQLAYSNSGVTNASRIESIQQCAANGDCLAPIAMDWESQAMLDFESDASEGASDNDSNNGGTLHQWGDADNTWTGDFNGDGKTDIASARGGNIYMKFYTDSGFDSEVWTVPNIWGSSSYTWAGDFNGDGLTDIASAKGGNIHMNLSTGTRFDKEVWTIPNRWGGSSYTWAADFNGDGLTDIASAHGGNVYMYLSTASGFESQVWTVPNVWGSAVYTRLGDFNGDGLMDIASARGGNIHMHLSTGSSFDNDVWTVPNEWGNSNSTWAADFNGDGLTDIAYRKGYAVHMHLSTGSGFYNQKWAVPKVGLLFGYPATTWVADFNGDGLPDIASASSDKAYINLSTGSKFYKEVLKIPLEKGAAGYQWLGDFDGSGTADIATSTKIEIYTKRSTNQLSKRLVAITDSNNNTTSISYKPLTDKAIYSKGGNADYPIVDLQFPKYVVSQVESSNGVGGQNTVKYAYQGLRAHAQGRGSLGFSKIIETYPDTDKTKTTIFDTRDFPYAGNPLQVIERYQGDIINELTTTLTSTVSSTGVYQLNVKRSVQKSYELGEPSQPVLTVTTTNNEIDDYGNIGQIIVETMGADGGRYIKQTDSVYDNQLSEWHIGRVRELKVTHKSPNSPNQVRLTDYQYDGDTGLVTQQRIVSTQTGLPLTTTEYTYNTAGLKIQTTVSAQGQHDRVSRTSYNSLGYVTRNCNVLSQCEDYTYTEQGWLATTTGPNGISTHWTYDNFGRKTVEVRADGTQTVSQLRFERGFCGEPAEHAFSCEVIHTTAKPRVIIQYDSLGREVRSIKTGFDGRLIFKDTEYNDLGQVERLSREYHQGDHIYWATSEYDALERLVRVTEPGPHGSSNDITTEYNGLSSTIYSGLDSRAKTTITNAIGQTIRVEEEGAYVDYTYDSTGNLLTTQVADDTDTLIKLHYDEFGRKIRMDDPDMGTWTYKYDAFGQLISQQDAKGQVTTMVYDKLGRLTQRSEDEGISRWRYYDNNAPRGSIGKLASESSPGISKDYTYDSLGRPDSTTTTIDGEDSFTTEVIYDARGRVRRTVYPGTQTFFTENVYNANGYLARVRGLKAQAESHDLGQLQPLIQEAVNLADEYQAKAGQLASLGAYYQSRIDSYGDLLDKQTIRFESGTTVGLDRNRAYDYLSAGDGVTYYIRVPDTYVANATAAIITPIVMPATHHYRVTDSNNQQSIAQITAAQFAAVAASLNDTGDQVYVLNNNTVACACDSVEHDAYLAKLKQHQSLLTATVAQGETIPLSPELMGHVNNTLVELKTVQSLINQQSQSYANSAEQLVVLAQQTLAAADHTFQFVRTLDNAADAYEDMLADDRYITYWRAVDVDASGRISAEVYGNGIVNDYAYNQGTGQLQSIHSSLLVFDAVRHLEYQYDAYNNVTLRDDLINDIRETYSYDRLDRLTEADVSSDLYQQVVDLNTTQSITYDVLGNITHKSDVGDYHYGQNGAGVHAVTEAGDKRYQYDANGNMVSGDNRTIQWSSFNKPLQITQSGRSASFQYGPDRARFKKVNHKGDTTLYIGKLYERTTKESGDVEQQHFIYAAGQLVAQHVVSTTNGTQTRYLHKDALGSIDLVTDAYANVVDRRSFDAWGKLRNLPWQSQAGLDDPLYLTQLPLTNKGYTGHESIQEVGLIHMNGRVYDASLGRFLSADPHIQAASLSQSHNRYSYVLNNPMKYTDPSGYFFKKLFKSIWKVFKAVVGIVVAAAVNFFCGGCATGILGGLILGALAGGVSAAVNGGNVLQGALLGGLSGALFGGIGSFTQSWAGVAGAAGKVLLHGLAGGTLAVIRGGKFGVGFLSAGFAKFANLSLQAVQYFGLNAQKFSHVIGRTVISAIAGGTASVVGGGKFAMGAATAAAAHLFNAESSKRLSDSQIIKKVLREVLEETQWPGWVRPEGAEYVVGREGIPGFSPGKGITGWLEDNVPGMHMMGIVHDEVVRRLTVYYGMSDARANVPTMPGAYARSVNRGTAVFQQQIENEIGYRFLHGYIPHR